MWWEDGLSSQRQHCGHLHSGIHPWMDQGLHGTLTFWMGKYRVKNNADRSVWTF